MTVLEFPRLASIERDSWELESGEGRNVETGGQFQIPPREARESLRPGDAAQLLFWIENPGEDGSLERDCERMWVLVERTVGDYFVGSLDNYPVTCDPESGPLFHGATVWFRAEHVINISQPEPEPEPLSG